MIPVPKLINHSRTETCWIQASQTQLFLLETKRIIPDPEMCDKHLCILALGVYAITPLLIIFADFLSFFLSFSFIK